MDILSLATPLLSLDVSNRTANCGEPVRVWRVSLVQPQPVLNELYRHLSSDERTRASRFHFEKDRNSYITARGMLRTLLGEQIGVEPHRLEFCYSEYGKPDLTPAFSGRGVRFNVSHSGRQALFAMSRGLELGVDVEYIRADFASMEIAERFFSRREVAVLKALPSELQVRAFFDCWTRKEAYLKATGVGLSLPLDKFDVAFAPGEPAALLYTDDDPTEAGRWTMHDLRFDKEYAAALALEAAASQG